MKKLFSFVMSAVLVLSIVSGCGSNDNQATNNNATNGEDLEVVRIVLPGINDQATIDPISGIETLGAEDYEKIIEKNVPGVDIQITSIPWDNWIQKTEAMIESNEVDIAFYTNQVLAAEWFMDHSEFLEDDPDLNFDNIEDIFSKSALSYLKYSSFNFPDAVDKIFGLPLRMSNYFLVYDAKIFEDWGVEPPGLYASFEEIVEKAEQVTGENPVTGTTNYGAYITSFWMEWNMISFDAVKPYFSNTMMLNELDTTEYVDYIKDSDEVLNFYEHMARLIDTAPAGIITRSGGEKFYTEENDIGIDFSGGNELIQYYQIGDESITERFKPVFVPSGEFGQGFPEFSKVAVTKTASNPDIAWEVVKTMAINKEVNGFYIDNYAKNSLPAFKDYDGMNIMDIELNKLRHEYHSETLFETDDYWFWRTPAQTVNAKLVSKEITPEEAREELHTLVAKWVSDTKKQLGQ